MIDRDDGDPFMGMEEAEYADFCAQFARDRLLEDAQDYLAELDNTEDDK